MVVRNGREFLAIPGPTTIPDEVLRAMHRPAVDIYSGPLLEITDSLLHDLSRVFRTKGRSYIYIANGHGAWEAALTNVLSKGDKILVLESGRFALGWGNAASALGVEVEVLKGDWRRAVCPVEVEARLRRDKAGKIKAILVAHIDTSSGVVNDIEAIGKAIKAARHDGLFLVDAVASLGCVPFEMDAWSVDVAMSGSQKGLMTPPGLGFVAANDRARKAHRHAQLRTPYWDWTARDGKVHYQKYAGTPPEHLLFALRAALDMIFAEKLDKVFRRHRLLAEAVRRAVAVWAEGQAFDFNILEPSERWIPLQRFLWPIGVIPVRCRNIAMRNAASFSGRGSEKCRARPSALPIWGTSTLPWFWERSGSSKSGSMRCISLTAREAFRLRSNGSAGAPGREHPRSANGERPVRHYWKPYRGPNPKLPPPRIQVFIARPLFGLGCGGYAQDRKPGRATSTSLSAITPIRS
jgi:alanine-glyoxylate transaminase / serine-glyoxylate transaminase / serine-pyruvate transaminase